ncbi:RecF/RecN/SMC protein [Teladorsagia circumcincta]|uniref:RecF/RecN/SMC protein n=1 Tax=Teladorsagia circumcincta TaxID=45464 RepID=A0A2G9UMY4_TELCI|nr:RecF/RecN/SMC protein [Teladorsagia circumcincta]
MARKKRVDSDDDSDFSSDDEKPKKKPAKKRHSSPAKSPPGFKRKQAKPNTPAKVSKGLSKDNKKRAEQKQGDSSSEGENEFVEEFESEDLLRMVIPPRPQPCMKPDGSGARLVIREIVATNFKSYYGKQRIGPFHKNFTAIIGPNGSGKSNVIDSLLFVFGYKASKIRSKKLSVLIHSSRGHDDINSCSVEVFFEQIIDKVPIEKLSAKVEILKEQRSQALQRVRAADREKVALEAPVREMISYLKAENHAVLLRNQLFHIKLFKILEEVEAVQPLRDAAYEKKAEVDKALKDVLDAREADNDRLEAAQRDETQVRGEEKAVRDEIGALERSSKARANTMKRNVADIARVADEIEKEKQKLEELKGVPARAAAKLEVLKASIVELNELERENIKKADDNRDKFDRKAGPEKAERARLEEEMGGDLGTIDKKYDAAISTTTAALDSYVVESTNDGHEAIDYLVKKNLGRTNFIILDKTNEFKDSMDTKKKFGLIGNKEKGKADQALRDAQGRLPALVKELDEKSEKLAETSQACRQMEQRIFALSNDANRLRTQYNACDNEILKLTERISHMEKQVVYVNEQLQKNLADENEVAAKKAEIEAASIEREACAKEVAAAKAKVDVVAAKVKSIFHEFVQKYLDEADTAKKRRQEIEEQAVKERVSIDLNEHNMEKVQNRIKFLEKSLAEKKAKEQKLLEEEESSPKQLTQLKSQQAELKRKLEEIEEFLKNTRQRREDFNRDELKYLKELKICTDELAEKEASLKALQVEVDKLKKQMDALTLHQTQDFDIIPKVVKPRHGDDSLDDSLLGDLAPAEKETEKKGKKRDKKKGGDAEEEYLESPDGKVPKLTREDVVSLDREHIKFTLTNLEQRQLSTRTDINMHVIHDYKEKLKKLEAERAVLDAARETMEEHMAVLDNMRRDRLVEFMDGFERIGLGLKEMYQMITLGGDASLDLKDSMDPFTQGIQFMVRPPKKSWKQIENLSGGEKTLASLSLVFALHHYRPTPLYVMDEIDAALDFKNVSIIAHYIKTFDRTQNVVVDPPQVISVQEECARRDQLVLTRSSSTSDDEDQMEIDSITAKRSQLAICARPRSDSGGDDKEN